MSNNTLCPKDPSASDFAGACLRDRTGFPLAAIALGLALLFPAIAGAEVELQRFTQEVQGDGFGANADAVGDVNGDGFPDLVVAAASSDLSGAGTGRVYLFHGGPNSDDIPDLMWVGDPGRHLGASVAGAGDVNGDGFDDIAIGDSDSGDGRVYIHFGGTVMDTTADVTLVGEAIDDYFGNVSGAGDVNGDGYADIVVGAVFWGSLNNGRAYVYYGGSSMDTVADLVFTGESSTDYLGEVVCSAGDMNGDGYDDILVTAENYDVGSGDFGRAYVYFGGPGADSVPDRIFTGETTGSDFGTVAAGIGDVNGDGFDDVIVGAPRHQGIGVDSGRAYVYPGGTDLGEYTPIVLEGENIQDWFGSKVAEAGDLNQDGYDDFMVSAAGYDEGGVESVGKVSVYFGGPGQDESADLEFVGTEEYAFYAGLGSVGDWDGDGIDDLYLQDGFSFGPLSTYARDQILVASALPYLIDSPDGGETWMGGSIAEIRWRGNQPANLDLSLDGGVTWSRVEWDIGGSHANVIPVPVPTVITDQAMIRLTYTGQSVVWSTSRRSTGYFRIVAPAAPVSDRQELELAGLFGDEFGIAVNHLGDVNGDGFGDIIVGATRAGGLSEGRAYVYFRGPGHDDIADLVLSNGIAGSFLGRAVGPAGDINGDGHTDILVGAEGATGGGAAYVYYGGPGVNNTADLTFAALAAGDGFGRAAAAAGDVNGDGYDDIIVGANGNDAAGGAAGAAYVYYGGVTPDTTADLTFLGESGSDLFGIAVSSAGDYDGDGFDDLLVGAYNNTAGGSLAGRAYVFRGGPAADNSADWVFTGEPFDYLGISLARAGDMNGDGEDDIVVGTLGLGTLAGRALVFHGGHDADEKPDLVVHGEASGDNFGISVASPGDVNHDGFSDLLVGAHKHDTAGNNAGAAYVFFGGPQPDAVADRKFLGKNVNSEFGAAVGSAGDAQGDGFDDLLIGAYNWGGGRVYLVDFDRYHLTTPAGGETWNVGAAEDIVWTGSAPADLWLSVDGGNSYDLLRSKVGGNRANALGLVVPHQPTRFARVKVAPQDGSVTGAAVSDSLFTIEASIALLNLKAEPYDGGGMLLSWQTDPGPADLAGYKLERSAPGDNGWRVIADLVRDTEYLDTAGDDGMRYRLSGINGLGQELVLGETAPSPSAALSAWPLPYRGGDLSVSFLTAGGLGGAPGSAQVAVFDIRGRRVRSLVSGDYPSGMQETVWDGTDDQGRSVANGVYFLRVASQAQATKLKLVVLR